MVAFVWKDSVMGSDSRTVVFPDESSNRRYL